MTRGIRKGAGRGLECPTIDERGKMPAIIYKNKAGDRIPSVTTIISQWGNNKQALLAWAWKQGEKGISLYEKPEADIGTLAHMMIDADVKGKIIDLGQFPMNIQNQAKTAYDNFSQWKSTHNFKPVETEISLTSEKYQYGGTIDCIAMLDGKLSILDLKTGKEVYEDHPVQIAAYAELWSENFPDHKLDGGFHIIRTGKEMAMFAHTWYSDFPGAWDAFLHLRALYDLAKEIKKFK